MKQLQVGEFYLQANEHNPILLKAPKLLLGDRWSMSESQWQSIKQYNLEHYYQKQSMARQ